MILKFTQDFSKGESYFYGQHSIKSISQVESEDEMLEGIDVEGLDVMLNHDLEVSRFKEQ